MNQRNGRIALVPVLALAILRFPPDLPAQAAIDDSAAPAPAVESLQMAPQETSQLQRAINEHDYITAEKLLLAGIDRDPQSPHAARLLAFIGTIYFRSHDYLNAAVAWKKSEAIAPLDPQLRFLQAMAYVRMSHSDWARPVLESLAAENKQDALYPYWLGRLDYDGHKYEDAIRHFRHAIELDPKMSRAYDNLGLCYYYENQNDLAVTNYEKAIELDREHPSPWPYLNLAITQQFLNRLPEAEKNLREAIRLDPALAKAHFQLGTVLEDLQRPEEALKELREAARLDATYAEPHMAMARVLHKLGHEAQARDEAATYLRLHEHATP